MLAPFAFSCSLLDGCGPKPKDPITDTTAEEYIHDRSFSVMYRGGWTNSSKTVFCPSFSIFNSIYNDFILQYLRS